MRRVVTDRGGGVSTPPYDSFNLGSRVGDIQDSVTANRRRLHAGLDLGHGFLAWMSQVHGAEVAVIGASAPAEWPICDAMVTASPGVALVVLAADCVPVLLADTATGVVGVAHAGREGVRLNVLANTVETMITLGASPETIDVLLGPAICGLCYEVSEDLQQQVETAAPGGAVRSRAGAPALDLRAALANQLAHLRVGRVTHDPRCTAEDPRLFSHRRDGVTGRQAGIAWLP